jgi:hypothetical protein
MTYIAGRDNLRGKVDVDALLFTIDTACRREIEIVDDLFLALIKSLSEFFSDHSSGSLPDPLSIDGTPVAPGGRSSLASADRSRYLLSLGSSFERSAAKPLRFRD